LFPLLLLRWSMQQIERQFVGTPHCPTPSQIGLVWIAGGDYWVQSRALQCHMDTA